MPQCAKLWQTMTNYAKLCINLSDISICATVFNSIQKYVKVANLMPYYAN